MFPQEEFSICGSDVAADASGDVYVVLGGGVRSGVIKYGPAGSQLWERDQGVNCVTLDKLGNVYAWGTNGPNYGVVEYSPSGNVLNILSYNGQGNGTDYTRGVAVDAQGGIYVTGYSYVGPYPNNNYELTTVKFDSAGNQVWARHYGAMPSAQKACIAIDRYGDIVVAGNVFSPSSDWNVVVLKYSAEGELRWQVTCPSEYSRADVVELMTLDSAGGSYVAFSSATSPGHSSCVVAHHDRNGTLCWSVGYQHPQSSSNTPRGLGLDGTGAVYVADWCGTTVVIKYTGPRRVAIVPPSVHSPPAPLRPLPTRKGESRKKPVSSSFLRAQPSVFERNVSIVYSLAGSGGSQLWFFDCRGRKIRAIPVSSSPGGHTVVWDGKDNLGRIVPTGFYTVILDCNGRQLRTTLLKVGQNRLAGDR
jgi:hypothetical protein